MGASTFLVGLLPTSETIGVTAAVLLILLRCLQGMAFGGESGGAAIFVAEYAPRGKHGYHTGFVQLSAGAGLVLSLVVIRLTEGVLGAEAFESWGWRLPFLGSSVLIVLLVYIRLHLRETPIFLKLQTSGGLSKSPIGETFGNRRNAWVAVITLFGLVAGQAVVTYTGLFYPLILLSTVLKVDSATASMLVIWSLLLGSVGLAGFGWLSDKVGRKPIILGGCLLASLTYFPLFHMVAAQANPDLHRAHRTVSVQLVADPATCSFQFNPSGAAMLIQPCDIAKLALGYLSVDYSVEKERGREIAAVRVAGGPLIGADPPTFARDLRGALATAGYPVATNPSVVKMRHPLDVFEARTQALIGVLTILVLYVTMVFGPIAAALVEMFPTRIRFTGMSLPYQLGNGWSGGLLPAIVLAMSAETGRIDFGLWYPVVIAFCTVVIGFFFVPETKDRSLEDEIEAAEVDVTPAIPLGSRTIT